MIGRLKFAATLLALVSLAACGARPSPSLEGDPLAGEWPAEVWTLRHQVRIDFLDQGRSFALDGLLRLSTRDGVPEIRALCLNPLGLTLCDMRVTPQEYRATVLHPGFAAIPDVERHMARCLRSVWFQALPFAERAPAEGLERRANDYLRLDCGPTPTAGQGACVVTATGPGEGWSVSFTPGEPQPPVIIFSNESEGYGVRIRLIAAYSGGE
jgi:hypothetical protein